MESRAVNTSRYIPPSSFEPGVKKRESSGLISVTCGQNNWAARTRDTGGRQRGKILRSKHDIIRYFWLRHRYRELRHGLFKRWMIICIVWEVLHNQSVSRLETID